MTTKKFSRGIAALALAMVAFGSAMAADPYPYKPIRIIVPVPPGGSIDITTRLVALKMSEKLGQPIIVENRPGGDTVLGTRLVKEQPADGYTILAQSNGFSSQPALKKDPGYDPIKDFIPLGVMNRAPMVVEVGGEQPERTISDYINAAKAGGTSFATPGIGSAPHLAAEMLMMKAGVSVLHIPYKGASAAYPDVITGRVPLFVDGYVGSAPYLKAGKMRALAVTGATRLGPLPEVPTLIEQGVDVTYLAWLGLIVRAGTPKEIVQQLSDALKYALSNKELIDRFRADGADPTFMTTADFTDYVAKEVAQVAKLAIDLKMAKD
jgi:tripartite-type tricarboxylate transporter receptor subunit TctC